MVTYAVVNGSAFFTVSSLQLNGPMAVYVVWSLYRSAVLIKRDKKVLNQQNAQGITDSEVTA
ncbi:hypothetical protein [Alteromonas sp. KUL42]|uniref:hypothetical protein n=1 Tax=Alteromonas sp. KUL42 TaxID=2480797 RepID=UPI00215AA5BD|nr:hypothetical protein [Alteromonas sp. KUL42]